MPKRPRSPLALVVLAVLVEAPMHAYAIQKLIRERGKDTVVNVAQRNSVHQALAKLVRDGLLREKETAQDAGRPEKTIYEPTELGRATLTEWLQEMLEQPAVEFPEFPAALSFIMLLAPDDAQNRLETRCAALRKRIAAIRASSDGARAMGLPRLFLVEDEYQLTMLQAELNWVEALREDLRSGALTWDEAWIRALAAAQRS